jgi:hypothetical protein
VPYDKDEMLRIQNEVEQLITKNLLHTECSFDFYDIKSAVSCPKLHINDGETGLESNHAGDDGLTLVALLFSSIVVHGAVSDSFFKKLYLANP